MTSRGADGLESGSGDSDDSRPVTVERLSLLFRELTLVMPAYNEEAGIGRVLEEARARLEERCERFEIVVVDDGSRDETPQILAEALGTIPELVVYTQPRNLGYAAALRRGLGAARYDLVLYTDADGQFDLADLDRAAPLLTEGVDFVAGYRADRADPWTRKAASAGFNWLARLAIGVRARDLDCAFKLFRKRFLDQTPLTSGGFLVDAEIYARAQGDGRRFVQLPVSHRPRVAGRSTIRPSAVWQSARELLVLRAQLRAERRNARASETSESASTPSGESAPEPPPSGRTASWRRLALTCAPALLALALGLFAQGTRGLTEPDEGRNVQIASNMLESGDWLVPRLAGAIYLDKPPLTFWAIAASLRLFGTTELAARLPLALAFAATAALVGWLGTMLWGARAGLCAGLAYAVSLGPFAGAAVVTPDTFLTLAVVLTAALFWRATNDDGRARFWLLAGAAAGAGLLVKGTAMLVFAAPLFLAESIRRRGLRWLAAPGPWLALAVALAIGLPWYFWIGAELPGAAHYFVSNQVTGRLAEQGYDRNSQPSKILTLYLPTLLVGALPWSLGWARGADRLLARLRRRELRAPSREGWFVGLWLFLPLAVFCAARSRLPLYLLPLFAPLALLTGRSLAVEPSGAGLARPLRSRAFVLALAALWVVALGGLKFAAAERLEHRDGRRLAAWVAGSAPPEPASIWAVDADLHSLPFYGLGAPRFVTTKHEQYPMYTPLPELGENLAAELPSTALLITPLPRLPIVRQAAEERQYSCRELPPSQRLAILDCRRPDPKADRPARVRKGRGSGDRSAADGAPPPRSKRPRHRSERNRADTPSRTASGA